MASFTRSGFRPAGIVPLSPNEVLEHMKTCAYSHKPVVGWVAAGAIHYYARSPAGAKSAVVQVLITDMFTHSGFYLAVSERSPSTAVSVLETAESAVKRGDF
jgi:hypothetical protein